MNRHLLIPILAGIVMASSAGARPLTVRDLAEAPGRLLGPQHVENRRLDDDGRRRGLEFSSAIQFRGHILVSDDETKRVEHDALAGKDRKGLALMELVPEGDAFALRRPWSDAFASLPRFDDIEGLTARGDSLYLMGSHSRNREGEPRPQREVLLRLDLAPDGSARVLQRSTAMREALVEAIAALDPHHPDRDPVDRALNLEGLSVAENGADLLVGVKAPLVGGRAVVLRLLAPDRFLEGSGEALAFRVETMLDLGGPGISSMEWDPLAGRYLVASSQRDETTGAARSSLWRWEGGSAPPEEVARFEGHALEGVCRLVEGPLAGALLLAFDNEWVANDGLTHAGGTLLVVRGQAWGYP